MKLNKIKLKVGVIPVLAAIALAACSDISGAPKFTFDPALHASYKTGAAAGDVDSICKWAMCCEKGIGTAKDETKAFQLYRKAADQGHAESRNRLGLCYVFARGTARNNAAGVECFRQAAQQGHVMAMANLGRCYENGIGVQRDLGAARQWYSEAASRGDTVSQYARIMCMPGDTTFAEGDWLRRCTENGLDSSSISSQYYSLKHHWIDGQRNPIKPVETYSMPQTIIRFNR